MRSIVIALILFVASPTVAGDEPDHAFEGRDVVWPQFEDSPPDAPTARMGFVFDPVSRSREAPIGMGEPVEVLLMAWDVQVALNAWEAHLEFDPRLTVVATEYISDLHMDQDGDVRAMLKPENCKSSPEIILARFTLMLLEGEASDLVLGIGPTEQPTALTAATDAPMPAPVYKICRNDPDIRPFLFAPVSAVLNPVSVHPDPVEGEAPRFSPEPARGRQ
jgi:hypothetical protein